MNRGCRRDGLMGSHGNRLYVAQPQYGAPDSISPSLPRRQDVLAILGEAGLATATLQTQESLFERSLGGSQTAWPPVFEFIGEFVDLFEHPFDDDGLVELRHRFGAGVSSKGGSKGVIADQLLDGRRKRW